MMAAVTFESPILCPILIGRAPYLESLTRSIEQVNLGHGQVALVAGEAGIGKSRLLAEVVQRAEGFHLLQGHCYETDASVPFAPFVDVLRSSLISDARGASPDASDPFANALRWLIPDPIPTQRDDPFFSPNPEDEKRRIFHSLTRQLLGISASAPLILIVEDLHWCDDTSLEFLLHLTRHIATQRVLLLMSYRNEEVSASLTHLLAELDRERLAHEFVLSRLTVEEVRAMLRATLHLPRSPRAEFLQRIYSLTEGNPFFVEEVLKSLVAEGDVFFKDGAWERKALDQLHIPRTVQDAVQRRSARLSAPAAAILKLAAVIGRHFDFSLMQQLAGLDETRLLELVRELIHAQLITEISPERFSFRHALTRQAVYSQLLGRERQSLHGNIAGMMVRLFSEGSELNEANVAAHFYDAGDWQPALEYSLLAGDRALSLCAPRAAVEHYSRALTAAEHLSQIPPAQVHHSRGFAYETLGDFDLALADYEEALRVERSQPEAHAEWVALIDLGKLWTSRDYGKTSGYFQAALALARQIDDPSATAYSLNRVGNLYTNLDRPGEAIEAHEEALAIFQLLEDQLGLAETSDLLGMASYIRGDLRGSTDFHHGAVELFRQLKDRHGLVSSLSTLTARGATFKTETMVLPFKRLSDAMPEGEEARTIAREIESRAGEAFALWCLGACLGAQGEYTGALRLANLSLEIAEETEHRQWITAANRTLGSIYLDLLAPARAVGHLQRALDLAQDIGSLHWIRTTAGGLAMAYILQDDLAEAQTVLDAAINSDAAMDSVGKRSCWLAYAQLALSRGDAPRALQFADELIRSAVDSDGSRVIPRLWKLRGDALLILGSSDAEGALLAGLETAVLQGALPLCWQFNASLGRLYRSQGRKDLADRQFAAAREVIYQIAKNVPEGTLRDDFTHRAGAVIPAPRPLSRRQSAKQEFDGLTERERQVAEMIAKGASNREIAAALVLSERTVETHVGNILSKLGFESRSRVAAWAVQKGLTH